jgi:hypothetical protein
MDINNNTKFRDFLPDDSIGLAVMSLQLLEPDTIYGNYLPLSRPKNLLFTAILGVDFS